MSLDGFIVRPDGPAGPRHTRRFAGDRLSRPRAFRPSDVSRAYDGSNGGGGRVRATHLSFRAVKS